MNEHPPASPGTPLDAELIRYLDGELDALGRARLERQLAADPAAATRLETLRRRGRRIAELLAAADAHVLANGRTPSHEPAGSPHADARAAIGSHGRASWARGNKLLRAAVVVLALAVAALAAPPVRALIADGIARLAEALGESPSGSEATVSGEAADAVEPSAAGEGFVVQLIVDAAEFRIDVESEQAAGSLIVRRSEIDGASAAIDGPADEAELRVSSGALSIRNSPGATASYVVVLPPTVRQVHVRLGTQAPIDMPLDRELRFELSRR